ncbi:hypothetical protein F4694_005885 [Bacillus niacini]|uniref:Uncharacterized protein n=1 Tax=Neobacillus niacini TaxID=86668 RepID=A0A852TPP2_9BACI|nr:hypothetical protein [Neobacillus niacini]NYE09028.1 hypothetical protein [Neobacillus niacini]
MKNLIVTFIGDRHRSWTLSTPGGQLASLKDLRRHALGPQAV